MLQRCLTRGDTKSGSLDDNLTEIRGKLSLIIALRFEFTGADPGVWNG